MTRSVLTTFAAVAAIGAMTTSLCADDAWTLAETSSVRTAGVTSARTIVPDVALVSKLRPGDIMQLTLTDGAAVPVIVSTTEHLGPQRTVITARIRGIEQSHVILARHGDGFAGSIRMGDGDLYRIRGVHTGAVQIETINADALPWCEIPEHQDIGIDFGADGAATAVQSDQDKDRIPAGVGGCDDGSIIDVFVPYSTAAKNAAGGTSNMLAEIDVLLADMNAALAFAETTTQVRLVHAREYPGLNNISLSSLTDGDDGNGDDIHAVRDAYEADQVAFIKSGGGGVANGMWEMDSVYAETAFCINGRDSVPYIIAHEIGHNLGCCHARGDGGGCPGGGGLLFPYSNGHRFFGDSGTQWRSVMAYSPGSWTGFYSNPEVLFDGQPTGIDESEPDSADNAKTINIAAPLVATWRCSDTTCMDLDLPPDAPDCDGNGVPDGCDIARGDLEDTNGDGIPDICQCIGDLNNSGDVSVADLLILLSDWGPCADCVSDINVDGDVNVADLLLLLAAWGSC